MSIGLTFRWTETQAASVEMYARHVHLEGDPGEEPEHAGLSVYLIWPRNTLGSPRNMLEARERDIWTTLLKVRVC